MRSVIGRFPADAVVLSVLSAWFAVKWVELVSQDDTERCRRIADAR